MGGLISQMFEEFSSQARSERAALFRQMFGLSERTRILDLGSESGANIHAVLEGTPVRPENRARGMLTICGERGRS